MLDQIKQTADFLRTKVGEMPKTAIILGTGLGALVDHMDDKTYIPYSEIPNFPVSTVEGHSGNLIFGTLGGKKVIAMQGRFHYYEGYDMKQVTFPVMTNAYDKELMALADRIAAENNIRLMHGVYVGVTGPTFETPAEYEYYRIIGGDCVGMSTVPEVIVANHAGMRVFGLSVITDLGGKDVTQVPTHEEVQQAALIAQPKCLEIMKELVNRF